MCDRSALAPTKPTHRSSVSNGTTLFAGVDGRTTQARRVRDVLDEILTEVGDATQSQQALARRTASLCVWAETQEAALARGETVDVRALTTTANTIRRLLADLGTTRRGRSREARA